MKPFLIAIVIFMLASCNSDGDKISGTGEENYAGSGVMCERPINVIYSKQKHTAKGYIVSFNKSVDLDSISAEYLKKYDDLEIYSHFSSLNAFHGNSGDKTLQSIQCEQGIKSIQYNIPQELDSKNT